MTFGRLAHALALKTFYPGASASCVEVKLVSAYLDGFAPGLSDSPAGRIAERRVAWASRLPQQASEAWAVVAALSATELLDLLAHCVSLGVNAVRNPLDRKPDAWAHADRLAAAAGLDMTRNWTATARSCFGRATKPRILDAVTEAKGAAAAERLAGLKKTDMAEAAEQALARCGWLPALLRTPQPAPEPLPEAPTAETESQPMAAE